MFYVIPLKSEFMRRLVWTPTNIFNRGIGLTVVRIKSGCYIGTLLTVFVTWNPTSLSNETKSYLFQVVIPVLKRIQIAIQIKLLDNSWSSFGVLSLMIRCSLLQCKNRTSRPVTSTENVTRVLVSYHIQCGVLRHKKTKERWYSSRTPTWEKIPSMSAKTAYTKVQKNCPEGDPGQPTDTCSRKRHDTSAHHWEPGTPYAVCSGSTPDDVEDTTHDQLVIWDCVP